MKNLLFIVLILLIMNLACSTSDCFRQYTFDFPVAISPALDTFNIGDTIWYEMNIDNLVEDKETGDLIGIS